MSLITSQIAQHEKKARARYLSAVQYVGNEPLPKWFNDFLEHHALPPLVRIGFDREIAASIFKISAPAWTSMGPVTGQKLRLHPTLARDIREIRGGIVSREEQEAQKRNISGEPSPGELADSAAKAMHPDTLSELLKTIPTSWIHLPRALSFLAKNDSHCLIIYLQHLDMETSRVFEKILARILIEFIGNYSLKFISSTLPKKQMVEAIFYGYAAMFWKNLLQPPEGLEDLLIFRSYLSWAKAFNKRACCRDAEKEEVIAEMEEMGNYILPDHNCRTLLRKKNLDASALHITLRHGRPGVNQAVRYFTINTPSLFDSSHDSMLNRTLPKQITILFRELRNSYDRETPRTRKFIHTFLIELRTEYSPCTPRQMLYRQDIRDSLAFTKGRMAHLIQDFSQSLH